MSWFVLEVKAFTGSLRKRDKTIYKDDIKYHISFIICTLFILFPQINIIPIIINKFHFALLEEIFYLCDNSVIREQK